MTTRRIIGWLSEEDHERYLTSYAMAMIALSGNSQTDPNDGVDQVIADQRLHAELRCKYEIDDEEAVTFSLYDGAILDKSEE